MAPLLDSAGSSELTITGTSDLGGSITTSTQTYSGAVTLSTDVTLTTTDSNITFSSTVRWRWYCKRSNN
jgi:hypothetical protein